MKAPHVVPTKGFGRWGMLAVVSLGIVALTLNWFDVATAFPLVGREFHVGLGSLSFLISLYIVGYGLSHIPGGMLATRIGMKRVLVLGLLVQGLAGVMSGLSYNYSELALFRVVSGVGGSVFVAMGTAAMFVWFDEKDLTLALGITGGAAFSAGAGFALYVWVYVQDATSWHTSLVLAGVFELLVMVLTTVTFHVPDGFPLLGGAKFDRAAFEPRSRAAIFGFTALHSLAGTAHTSPLRNFSVSTSPMSVTSRRRPEDCCRQ